MTTRSPRIRALAALCAVGLLAVACGDDDDTEATTDDIEETTDDTAAEGEAASAEAEEYCAAVEELDSQDGPPTEEQLLELKEIRPDDIGEEVDMIADAFIAAEGNMGEVFSDPEIEEAFGRMEAYDAETCGFESGGPDEEMATEPLDGAEVIQVTGLDYEFEGIPAEVPAGDVSFEFTNEGEDAHEMGLFKLGEGVDLDELLASEEEPSEDEAQEVGFTFAPPGEGGVFLNAEGLDAGTYAVVCFIPGPGGEAHYELGMKTTFTVS
jgi:uncharacterized cupredoxin-like copper-binding protein